jgi:hypothetical protein
MTAIPSLTGVFLKAPGVLLLLLLLPPPQPLAANASALALQRPGAPSGARVVIQVVRH